MIGVEFIRQFVENGLNNYCTTAQNGKSFVILADVGTTTKRANAYWGILSNARADIVPVRNIQLMTMSADLEVRCDLNDVSADSCPDAEDLRDILENYIAVNKGEITTYTDAASGTTYNVACNFQLPSAEIVEMETSDGGLFVPFLLRLYFSFYQNGVNSNDIELIVDGDSIVFERLVLTRSKIADSGSFTGDSATKTFVKQNSLSIDFTSPMLTDDFGGNVFGDIVGDLKPNTAHCVQIKRGNVRFNYICIFGNNQATLEVNQNVGLNVSFAEGKEDLLYYEDWSTISLTVTAGQRVTINGAAGRVVFWGDGTSTTMQGATTVHTYLVAGTYTMRIFGGGTLTDLPSEVV